MQVQQLQTDSIDEQSDSSDLSDAEMRLRGTVRNESATSYLVEYPDGSIESEPKTVFNTILFSADPGEVDAEEMSITATGVDSDSDDGFDDEVMLRASITDNEFVIQCGECRVRTPEPHLSSVTNALTRAVSASDGEINSVSLDPRGVQQVREAFVETMENRVRREVVDQFAELFGDSVDTVSEGWIIGDEYILTDDLVNLPLDRRDTGPEFIQFSTDIDGSVEVETEQYGGLVTESEQEFLGTAMAFVESEEALGVELDTGSVEQEMPDVVGKSMKSMKVDRFWDNTSGRLHVHSLDKHQVSHIGSLTDEARSEMKYNAFDHAGLHELHHRRDEFEDRDITVFEGDSESSWKAVSGTKSSAIVSDETLRDIKSISP